MSKLNIRAKTLSEYLEERHTYHSKRAEKCLSLSYKHRGDNGKAINWTNKYYEHLSVKREIEKIGMFISQSKVTEDKFITL